jgi:hypothetical protein
LGQIKFMTPKPSRLNVRFGSKADITFIQNILLLGLQCFCCCRDPVILKLALYISLAFVSGNGKSRK